ncbi:hypothetical protein QYE76_032226 [Lolium multiflorum]|uniref:Uncharacterized protein n=1 Tax=Lolium multiflorum TaxID=4521 RepID=A0AAD8VL39_LOLMU|nr:hypothetical protein QYE76_032226 [Lolium multiflorum]
MKKVAPEASAASAATAKDAPGDWPASTMSKRDEKKARSLGLILIRKERSSYQTSQLDQAVKIVATARQDADSLRKELGQLKKKPKEEEKEKAEAQAQKKERKDLLHKSTMAVLEAADIPINSVGKLPVDSSADGD